MCVYIYKYATSNRNNDPLLCAHRFGYLPGLAVLSAMLRPEIPTSLVCAKVDWTPFLSKFGAGEKLEVEGKIRLKRLGTEDVYESMSLLKHRLMVFDWYVCFWLSH